MRFTCALPISDSRMESYWNAWYFLASGGDPTGGVYASIN